MASTLVWPQQALSGLRLRSEPDPDLCLQPGQALLMCGQKRAILQPAVLLDALHPSLNPPTSSSCSSNRRAFPPSLGGALEPPSPRCQPGVGKEGQSAPRCSLQWEGFVINLF